MRGFPLLNFLLCLGLGLGVVAPLVWRATGTGVPVVAAVHEEVAAGRVEASVRAVSYTHLTLPTTPYV